MRCDPLPRARRAVRPDRDADCLVADAGVGFLASAELLGSVRLVIELVREDHLIVVAEAVEGPDWVRVVGPALVTRYVTLDRPRFPSIQGFVEAEDMVIALCAGEPLARANQVSRIGWVDLDVGFRVVVDQHGGGSRKPGVAPLLGGIRPQILTCGGRTIARRLAGVPVDGTVVHSVGNFRCVATDLLRGGKHVRHMVHHEAILKRVVSLRSLGDAPYSWPNGGGARRVSVPGGD